MDEVAHADVIEQLVEAQLAPWRDRHFYTPEHDSRLIELSNSHFGTFVFTVEQDSVSIRANPSIAGLVESGMDHEVYRRGLLFKRLISDAVNINPIDGRIAFAVNVVDMADSGEIPIFSFQKEKDETNILLPDFELIELGFLEEYSDDIPFEKKFDKAYFTGSTTGALNFTIEDIDAGRVARVRAARAFRSHDEVEFRLTNLVQYADESVRDALILEGFGGERAPLLESFQYKFGISIDGNGAPCSRPAVILKSKGVLIKYDSPYVLYYSSALIEGIHYLSVSEDRDVVRIVQQERLNPGLYSHIAVSSELFAQRFITKSAAMTYTSRLLSRYSDLLKDSRR